MAKSVFPITILVAALCMARQNDQKSQDIHSAFYKLRDSIFNEDPAKTVPHTPKDFQKITAQMDLLVGKVINSSPTGVVLHSQRVSSELKTLLTAPSPEFTNTPVAEVFELNGVRSAAIAYLFIAGSALDAAPDSYPRLDFYTLQLGEWKLTLRTPVEEEFNRCDYFVRRVNADEKSRAWFVLYGMQIGDSGARSKILIYSYDNTAVKKVWERRGLYGAEISVDDNVITVGHLRAKEDEEKIVAKYQVIGDQVQCVSAICQ